MPDNGNELLEIIGDVYSLEEVMSKLFLSESEVLEKIASQDLLCCRFGNGELGFPALQFSYAGEIIPTIMEVVKILASGVNAPWTWAMWLAVELEEYDNLSAAQWLRDGRDKEVILRAAREDASVWAH